MVDAGDNVTCSFLHTFPSEGMYTVEAAVEHSYPGDYDTSNNRLSTTIEIADRNDSSWSTYYRSSVKTTVAGCPSGCDGNDNWYIFDSVDRYYSLNIVGIKNGSGITSLPVDFEAKVQVGDNQVIDLSETGFGEDNGWHINGARKYYNAINAEINVGIRANSRAFIQVIRYASKVVYYMAGSYDPDGQYYTRWDTGLIDTPDAFEGTETQLQFQLKLSAANGSLNAKGSHPLNPIERILEDISDPSRSYVHIVKQIFTFDQYTGVPE